MANFISDKRLFLTADRSRVVEENDPAAAHLLVGAGGTVSQADAERYGLKVAEYREPTLLEREREGLAAAEGDPNRVEELRVRQSRVAALEAAEKAAPKSANKAVGGAPENKSR